MYTVDITNRLDKFMKKYGFRSHKVDCGELIFTTERGEEMCIREFKRKSAIHQAWRKLDEELLSEGPEWANAGSLPDLPVNVDLTYAAKSLQKAKPGTLDFAFWWWKILEKMRDLRDGGKK